MLGPKRPFGLNQHEEGGAWGGGEKGGGEMWGQGLQSNAYLVQAWREAKLTVPSPSPCWVLLGAGGTESVK